MDRRNEAITAPSECLDKHRSVRRFTERIAQPFDGGIKTMIKVDKGVRRPELIAQFLSGNQFSRMFQQSGQHLKRLFLELYFLSPLAEFPGLKINFKVAETDN